MIPRDERIVTELPMLYRPTGEMAWREARTENVSGTGVLFRARDMIAVSSPVEMTFDMVTLTPMKLASVATVVWRGNVVRTVQAPSDDSSPRIAATLAECTLLDRNSGFEV